MRTVYHLLDFALHRFDCLGNGCFSYVFVSRYKRHADRVLKICGSGDDWPIYATWGIKHGYAGGLTPRLYALRCEQRPHAREDDEQPYAAVVERLRPLACGDEQNAAKAFTSYIYSEGATTPTPGQAELLERYAPGWQAFVVALWETFGKRRSTYDLHPGNYMMRETPQGPRLVVTDPITLVHPTVSRPYRSSTSRVRARDFETWRARASVRGLPLFEYAMQEAA
jgi:hypothetical protein